ncbi:unnamed protein product [Phyllotreta striolata]|uniref:Uncharacterized protein n=1 Tax=Phyllotreta striolata TaxID=444603 RepID=A0A9N9XL23_PHYSR|nr:unnamed protein product [Phyllotreta striolata]
MKLILPLHFLFAISANCERLCKGLSYQNAAISCLENILVDHLVVPMGLDDTNRTTLVPVLTSNVESCLENRLIARISARLPFITFAMFNMEDVRYSKTRQTRYNAKFYIFFLDDYRNFTDALAMVRRADSFNPTAFFLVYVEGNSGGNAITAGGILRVTKINYLPYAAVLVNLDDAFELYQFVYDYGKKKKRKICGTYPKVTVVDTCVNGTMLKPSKNYNDVRVRENCIVKVVAKEFVPFVLSKTEGFEIDVLQLIGSYLKVTFDVEFYPKSALPNWGGKINGTWTGLVKDVAEKTSVGVGHIVVGLMDSKEFSYSQSYHYASLVWVIPKALDIPKWRILFALFSPQVWALCLGMVLLFAFVFYLVIKLQGGTPRNSLLTATQILIYQPVSHLPRNDLHNVFFLGLCVASIILNSVYTSSLLFYMKNPMTEHQASGLHELIDPFGNPVYEVGGYSKYKSFYNDSETETSRFVYDHYQVSYGENDTLEYWLRRVAHTRRYWTISTLLYAKYVDALDNITRTEDGKSMIFVKSKKPVSVNGVGLIMRRSHPLLGKINKIIQHMLYGGIQLKIRSKYWRVIEKMESLDNSIDMADEPLTFYHLEGAFAFLILGYVLGFLILAMEIIIYRCKKRKNRKMKDIRHLKRKKNNKVHEIR